MLGPELALVGRTEVCFAGRRLTFFGGNDYHRLSSRPETLAALSDAAARYGLNAAGSRATTGNHPLYRALEERAAAFLGTEAAAVCSAGYLSPAMALQAVQPQFSHLFLDEKAHVSLADAARTSGLPLARFAHADAGDLQRCLSERLCAGGRPLALTDGVFASSGRIPPLAHYAAVLAPYGGHILLDDAHAVAVVGASGRGSWEELGVPRDVVYQAATLSKGFGGFGGIVAGSRTFVDAVQRTSAFVGGTPLPLPVAAASLRAIELLASELQRLSVLRCRSELVKPELRAIGFAVPEGPAPICSVTFLDETKNRVLSDVLLERGIHPPFISYPGCPPGGHFRFTLSSEHTDEQIEAMIDCARESVRRAGPPGK